MKSIKRFPGFCVVALASLITQFCFFPALGSAQSAPQVTSISPRQNALNVMRNASVVVVFDQDMDAATITSRNFIVYSTVKGPLAGAITYKPIGRTAVFNPTGEFMTGDVVTVELTTKIMSAAGIALDQSYIWSFTVIVTCETGYFATHTDYYCGSDPWAVRAADTDGDGDLDLPTALNEFAGVSIMENDGNGVFDIDSSYYAIPVTYGPEALVAAELDGSPGIDLAISEVDNYSARGFFNSGTGIFAYHWLGSVGDMSKDICAADLDGDGDIDLAAAAYYSYTDHDVAILLNNGTGGFAAHVDYPISGSYPSGILAADVDNDFDVDLVVSSWGSDNVSVLLNNGHAGFFFEGVFPVGDEPECVAAGDLDADGDLDLVVPFTGPGTSDFAVLLNYGDGTFAPPVVYDDISNPMAVYIADFNADGALDVACADEGVDRVHIFRNDGNAVFDDAPFLALTVGDSPVSVFAADLDNDLDLDVATANQAANTISVLLYECTCDCSGYCNMDDVAGFSPVDVAYMVNYVYKGLDARPVLPLCPGDNGDWDCNGLVAPLDVTWYVLYVYRSSGVGPCNPCDCVLYPTNCPTYP